MIDLKISMTQNRPIDAAKMQAQADQAIGAGLVEMGAIFEGTVKENTRLGATRVLRGSIYSEPRGVPIREVLVSTPQLYGAVQERGRMPGNPPPVGPILLWVKFKGMQPRKKGQTLLSIAYAIARSIAKKGTSGMAEFFNGFNQGRSAAETVANKMGDTIVAEWEK